MPPDLRGRGSRHPQRRCLKVLPLTATVVGAAITDHARGISHPLP